MSNIQRIEERRTITSTKWWLSFFFVVVFIAQPVSAEEVGVDQALIKACNKVMLEIFKDVKRQKYKYRELSEFGNSALTKNEHGIYKIDYRFKETYGATEGQPFEFGVTIVPMDAQNAFGKDSNTFNFGFPILDLKFTGFQIQNLRSKQFDILESIRKHGQGILDLQQEHLPFRLTLTATKDEYKVNEDIEFTVKLRNSTKTNLSVKELNDKTLLFVYKGQSWGGREMGASQSSGRSLILKPNETLSKSFAVSGVSYPQEFTILCSYDMTFDGVNPDARLSVRVVE